VSNTPALSVSRSLSRRRLLGGGLATLALGGLAACGEDGTDAASAGDPPSGSGPWTWTDDLGQEIELRTRPTWVAAYGDAAAALINFGITPVALFHHVPPDQDPTFEALDLADVQIVGEAYGEIDLERLAAAAPDLVVTTSYRDETPELMFGFKDEAQMEKVRALAPVIGVMQTGSALDVIRANEGLAAALGADVDGGRVAEDRADFEAASDELTDAAARGLTVQPLHQVSWENADLYPADMVLQSMRGSLTRSS
jgi:iron-desferrioxamine transport system substrate-binding protein